MEISIILPVYNVAPYIEECVRSIARQTFKDWELIVIDDASPDESIDRLTAGLREAGSLNWTLVKHERNRGLAAARNSGLEKAAGKYVVFVDSDDYLDLNFLEKLYTDMSASCADIVVSGLKTFDDENRHICTEELPPQEGVVSGREALFLLLTGRCRSYICTQLYKREIFDQIRFPEGYVYEDRLTAPYLFLASEKVQFVRRTGYNYRQRQGSITKSFQPGVVKNVAGISKVVSDLRAYLPDEEGHQALAAFKCQNLYSFILSAMIRGDNYQAVRPIWKESWRYLHLTDILANLKDQKKPMTAALIFKFSPGLFWLLFRKYYKNRHGL